MDYLTASKEILKDYFDNVILIDDELDLRTREDTVEVLTDDQLEIGQDEYEPGPIPEEAGASIEGNSHYSPNELYTELIKEGFVTYGYKYFHEDDETLIENVIKKTKLLIIDWNLTNTRDTTKMGNEAKDIIGKFFNASTLIRFCIIYTREEPAEVYTALDGVYDVKWIDSLKEKFIFTSRGDDFSSCTGLIVSKKTDPNILIDDMGQIILSEKSLLLHLMESSNRLEKNLEKSMRQFTLPFEKILYTQFFTSNNSESQISKYINEKLISTVLEYDDSTEDVLNIDFLFVRKRQNILNKLNHFDEAKLKQLLQLINFKEAFLERVLEMISKDELKKELVDLITNSNSLYDLESRIKEKVERLLGSSAKKVDDESSQLVLGLLLFADYHTEEEFKKTFYEQTLNYTRMIKFTPSSREIIGNGTILLKEDTDEFMLCITPICDLERHESIDSKFKFIIGTIDSEITNEKIKNAKSSCYYMSLPVNGTLIWVKWKMYETQTFEIDRIKDMKFIGSLQSDYIKTITNKYISYQSRLGIEELFYKETNFIDRFTTLLDN